MEQRNRFAPLGSPSAPTREINTNGFMSALDVHAMGVAAVEEYAPTPTPLSAANLAAERVATMNTRPTPPSLNTSGRASRSSPPPPALSEGERRDLYGIDLTPSPTGSYAPVDPRDADFDATPEAALLDDSGYIPLVVPQTAATSVQMSLLPTNETVTLLPSPLPSQAALNNSSAFNTPQDTQMSSDSSSSSEGTPAYLSPIEREPPTGLSNVPIRGPSAAPSAQPPPHPPHVAPIPVLSATLLSYVTDPGLASSPPHVSPAGAPFSIGSASPELTLASGTGLGVPLEPRINLTTASKGLPPSTPPPPSDMGAAAQGGRMTACPGLPVPDLSPPRVFWEDTQARDARAILARVREYCERPGPSQQEMEALERQAGDDALDASHEAAEALNLSRLGLGHYVQREPIYPIGGDHGRFVGSEDSVNAAFKTVCGALSLGFTRGEGDGNRALHAQQWFRTAAATLAAVLRGALSSEDVRHLGGRPVFPCLDNFQVDESVPCPDSRLELVTGLADQIAGELASRGGHSNGDRIDFSLLWDSLRTDAVTKLRTHAEEVAAAWTFPDLERTTVRNINMVLHTLTDRLEALETLEGPTHLAIAREMIGVIERDETAWRKRVIEKSKRDARPGIAAELEAWRANELEAQCVDAVKERVARMRGDELQVLEEEAFTRSKHELLLLAESRARSGFQDQLAEALSARWPGVEEEALGFDRDSYLEWELRRVFPEQREDVARELKAQREAHRLTKLHELEQSLALGSRADRVALVMEAAKSLGLDLVDTARVPPPIRTYAKKRPRSRTAALQLSNPPPLASPGAKRDVTGRSRSASVCSVRSASVEIIAEDLDAPMVLSDHDLTPTASPSGARTTEPLFGPDGNVRGRQSGDIIVPPLVPHPSEISTVTPTLGSEQASHPPSQLTATAALEANRPEMVGDLLLDPEVEVTRGLQTSVHNPANHMDSTPDPAPAPLAPPPPLPPPASTLLEDCLLTAIDNMLAPLRRDQKDMTVSLLSLARRIDAVEKGKLVTSLVTLATCAPQPVKAASSHNTTPATSATSMPQPVKGKARSSPPNTSAAVPAAGNAPGSLTTIPATQATPTLASVPEKAGSSLITTPADSATPMPERPSEGTVGGSPSDLNPPRDQPPHSDDFTAVRRVRTSFAVATARGIAQQTAAKDRASTVAAAQGRTPTGRPKVNSTPLPAKPTVTDVVVIRNGGFDDDHREKALRMRHPGDIVREVSRLMETQTRQPLKLLKGRWSTTAEKTGNFVYTVVGDVPFTYIASFNKWLCAPFPGGDLVAIRSWKWAQLRGVLLTDDTGTVWEPAQLEEHLRENPMFSDCVLSVVPHWFHNPHTLKAATSTVLFAYEDVNGARTQAALHHGVAMFGYSVKFVLSGDKPSLIQCARCYAIGHRDGSPECRVPLSEVRCVRCGGKHDTRDHDFECAALTHERAGTCNCTFPCLLCGKTGHNARSRSCPKRGDFPAPRYACIRTGREPAGAAEANPPPAWAAPARTRARQRGGKGKGRASSPPLAPTVPTPPPPPPIVPPAVAIPTPAAGPPPPESPPDSSRLTSRVPTRIVRPTVPDEVRRDAAQRVEQYKEENVAGLARVMVGGRKFLAPILDLRLTVRVARDWEAVRLSKVANGDIDAWKAAPTTADLARIDKWMSQDRAFATTNGYGDPNTPTAIAADNDSPLPLDLSLMAYVSSIEESLARNSLISQTANLWGSTVASDLNPAGATVVGPALTSSTLPHA